MAERVTDQTAKTTAPADDDVLHVVDISDTTDNAAGSSFKMGVANFLKGKGLLVIQGCYTIKDLAAGNESTTILEAGDLVLYESVSNDDFIIATIKAAITVVPDDLRDSSKAALWLETTAAL